MRPQEPRDRRPVCPLHVVTPSQGQLAAVFLLQQAHAQISYVGAMSEVADPPPKLPDDIAVLKAMVGERDQRIAVLEEQLCDDIVHSGCLAHARRGFDEALIAQKAKGRGGLAAEGHALIQRIYRIKKIAREADMDAEARKRLREEKARPERAALRQWLNRVRGHAPPSTLVGKALTYLDNQRASLVRVLDDGRLEADNNRCENAIRPIVLGR